MRMKKSQFKALVKECLREILQEDVLLNRATHGAMQEGFIHQHMQHPQQSSFFNPMDDQAMAHRQMLLQQSLQNQSFGANQMHHVQQQYKPQQPNMAMLAGLDEGSQLEGPTRMSRDPNQKTPGTRNPSDWLRLAAPSNPRASMRPDLDVDARGQYKQPQMTAQHPQNYLDAPVQKKPRQLKLPSAGSIDEQSDTFAGFSPEIMREIYNDTAKTTFAMQAQEGHIAPSYVSNGQGGASLMGIGDKFDQVVSQNDPVDLFGPGAKNWGSLAFSD